MRINESHDAYLDAIAREMKSRIRRPSTRPALSWQDRRAAPAMDPHHGCTRPRDADLSSAANPVVAINSGIDGIPRERVRLHICYGNWEGPHIHDIALEKILPALYQAKVGRACRSNSPSAGTPTNMRRSSACRCRRT